MKQLLLLIIFSLQLITATAQKDSVSAYYIQTAVEQIDSNLTTYMELSTDTTITDNEGTMTAHTRYYINRGSGQVEKIMEKTLFGKVTTEIAAYYRGSSLILFSSKQWQGPDLIVDFDYYFQAGSPVYLAKRTPGKGNPNSDKILKWGNQLWKESESKKLAKAAAEQPTLQKKVTSTKSKDSTAKKPLLPFFKKKKQ